jgi:hypothetical protein
MSGPQELVEINRIRCLQPRGTLRRSRHGAGSSSPLGDRQRANDSLPHADPAMALHSATNQRSQGTALAEICPVSPLCRRDPTAQQPAPRSIWVGLRVEALGGSTALRLTSTQVLSMFVPCGGVAPLVAIRSWRMDLRDCMEQAEREEGQRDADCGCARSDPRVRDRSCRSEQELTDVSASRTRGRASTRSEKVVVPGALTRVLTPAEGGRPSEARARETESQPVSIASGWLLGLDSVPLAASEASCCATRKTARGSGLDSNRQPSG